MNDDNAHELKAAVLHRAACEVRYDEGIVYLDRCGSLTRDLQKVVGKGFAFSLPTVDQGELNSSGERMVVRYGPKNLSVIQDGVEALARFTQISTWSWQTLGSVLEVNRKVTRCGFRFQFLFGAASVDHAEMRILKSGLIADTPQWTELFGTATARQYIAKVPLEGWKYLGVQLGVLRMEVNGKLLPEIEKFYPSVSVHLDLDFVLREGEPDELRHADLRDWILRAWSRAQEITKRVGERCAT